jgi:hypothetical protein
MIATRQAATGLPTVSVIIAAYSDERWQYLNDAIESVLDQTAPATDIVVAVDHNPALLERVRSEFPGVTAVPNAGRRGASGARNTGVRASRGDVLAFLDDDACATSQWLETLLRHFADARVVGVGGKVVPLWATDRPKWFPCEFDWVVGASYRGMPENAGPVRNVWSNNMAIRRAAFQAVGGFRESFGKVGEISRPEDTDLCLRATVSAAGGAWMYEPDGIAGHQVPGERAALPYFLRRCFREGWGKAVLAALDGAAQSMSSERHHALSVLPGAVFRGLRDSARGDWRGTLRSAAIVAGLVAATSGFVVGWLGCLIGPANPRTEGPA